MRVAIVGHGPSLLKREAGAEIDGHDCVVRLKRSAHLMQRPNIFGGLVDVVACSGAIAGAMRKEWPEVSRFWVFADSRNFGQGVEEAVAEQLPGGYCNEALCKRWVDEYVALRDATPTDPRQQSHARCSDDLGHLHCSAGTFALIYALHVIQPEEVTLYGFDNVRSGTFDWSLTRGPAWDKYPDHNWEAESRLIPRICNAYGYRLEAGGEEITCKLDM